MPHKVLLRLFQQDYLSMPKDHTEQQQRRKVKMVKNKYSNILNKAYNNFFM